MLLKSMEIIRGRDFVGDLECGHCGHKQRLRSGYDDEYYHNHVIPSIKCEECGRATTPEDKP